MFSLFNKFFSRMKSSSSYGLTPLHYVDIPVKKATFGMGCFWSNDSLFGATLGVIRTRVGYAGGTTPKPNYRNIGDHTEVIEIDYDPEQITYDEILNLFWNNHEYGLTTHIKRQYRSLIIVHDDLQRASAIASHKKMETQYPDALRTDIINATEFFPAEDYHQKYRLQGHKDLCASIDLKPGKMLQESHLAARLNGYLVGVGGLDQFNKEAPAFGMGEEQLNYVREALRRNEGGGLAC